MKTHILFGLTVVVLIIAFMVGSSYYKGKQAEKVGFLAQKNAELFVRDHSQTLGSADAKVYLIEFMDPACETCAAFFPFVKQIMDANPGRIKLVLRYAPFHEGADYFVRKNIENILAKDTEMDTLILGCTHYPLLEKLIRKYVPPHIEILKQGHIVAEKLIDYLERHPEMELRLSQGGKIEFQTTEAADNFKSKASLFMGREVDAETVSY